MQNLEINLVSHFNKIATTPFLFIGSGLSRRYLGLDTWKDLLSRFCICGKPIEYYYSSSNQNLPKTASLLAEDFHKHWWSSDQYTLVRNQSSKNLVGTASALKVEICNYLLEKKLVHNDEYAKELSLLNKMNDIQGVITTNWDCFIEEILPDFKVYVGQEDLLFSTSYGVGEIYKLHGCSKNSNSIVLTEEDYNNFEIKNYYLISKLLTIFVEHPVIFLGYSLQDTHVTEIFKKIMLCLGKENASKIADKIIFVEWVSEKNIYSYSQSYLTLDQFSLPITNVKCSSLEPVYKAIISVKRKIPTKVLRVCKERIYDLIVETKKNKDVEEKKVYLLDIDEKANPKDYEFVLGVGLMDKLSEQGYIGLKNESIFHDIVFGNNKYEAEVLLKKFFPEQVSQVKFLPVYKYLLEYGIKTKKDFIKDESLAPIKKYIEHKKEDYYYTQKKIKSRQTLKSIKDITNTFEPKKALYYIPFLNTSEIDTDDFGEFLKQHYHFMYENSYKYYYRKLVCLYDKLKYGF